MHQFLSRVNAGNAQLQLLESFVLALLLCLASVVLSGCSRSSAAAENAAKATPPIATANPISIEDAFVKGMQAAKRSWDLEGKEYDVSIKRATGGWSMTVTIYPRTWSSQMMLLVEDTGKVIAVTGL